MIRRAYISSGRLLSPLFLMGLRMFTLLTGTERVRVVVINEKGEVLLLQGVISDGKWTLPGGGVARGERLAAAVRRELLEETGIDAAERDFTYLETLEKSLTKASYNAPLFLLRTHSSTLPTKPVNRWEIAHVGWFKMNNLPSPISPLTEHVLRQYKAEF